MTDNVDRIAGAVGMSPTVLREIMVNAQANHAKLRACHWHTFEPLPNCKPMRARYRCTACQGEIDGSAFVWHESGRRPKP